MDNIGRTMSRMGNYKEAIKMLENRVGKVGNGIESAWLHHEIGRCQLELQEYQLAKEHGLKCLVAAEEIHHQRWQMHALLLLGQAEVGLDQRQAFIDTFERARDIAENLRDSDAYTTIQDILNAFTDIVTQEESSGETKRRICFGELSTIEEKGESKICDETLENASSNNTDDDVQGGATADHPDHRKKETVKEDKQQRERVHFATDRGAHNNSDHEEVVNALAVQLGSEDRKQARSETAKGVNSAQNAHFCDSKHTTQGDKDKRLARMDPNLKGSSSSGQATNNSNPRVFKVDERSVGVESTRKLLKDFGLKTMRDMRPHESKSKRDKSAGNATMSFDNYSYERNVNFQLKQIPRPQTAKIIRPKYNADPRPQTAKSQGRKFAQSENSRLKQSSKSSKTKWSDTFKPPPSTYLHHKSNAKVGAATQRGLHSFSDDNNCSDNQCSDDYEQSNNSNAGNSIYNLFNLSSSESSEEMQDFENEHFQCGIKHIASDCALGANMDDKSESTAILTDDTYDKKQYRIFNLTSPDTWNISSDWTEHQKPRPEMSTFSESSSKERHIPETSRSCFPLPHSPFLAGSDTHALQTSRSKTHSSSQMFYSDSRMKNWLHELQANYSNPDSDSDILYDDIVYGSIPASPASLGESLCCRDNQFESKHVTDSWSPTTTGLEHPTYKSLPSKSLSQFVGALDSDTECNGNISRVRRTSPVNSSISSRQLSSATYSRTNRSLTKSAISTATTQYTTTAGRNGQSRNASFPVTSKPEPKSVSSDLLQQIYDPRGRNVKSALVTKGGQKFGRKCSRNHLAHHR